MSTRRRAYESGHKPKCLVVVDDTPECDRAVYYAARWAKRSAGGVVMLRVIGTDQRNQELVKNAIAEPQRRGHSRYTGSPWPGP